MEPQFPLEIRRGRQKKENPLSALFLFLSSVCGGALLAIGSIIIEFISREIAVHVP
jgi:hypothetical protein